MCMYVYVMSKYENGCHSRCPRGSCLRRSAFEYCILYWQYFISFKVRYISRVLYNEIIINREKRSVTRKQKAVGWET